MSPTEPQSAKPEPVASSNERGEQLLLFADWKQKLFLDTAEPSSDARCVAEIQPQIQMGDDPAEQATVCLVSIYEPCPESGQQEFIYWMRALLNDMEQERKRKSRSSGAK